MGRGRRKTALTPIDAVPLTHPMTPYAGAMFPYAVGHDIAHIPPSLAHCSAICTAVAPCGGTFQKSEVPTYTTLAAMHA